MTACYTLMHTRVSPPHIITHVYITLVNNVDSDESFSTDFNTVKSRQHLPK